MKNTKKTKRVISFFLITGLIFGIYSFCIIPIEFSGDAIAHTSAIKRIYDNGENAAIITLKDIKTVSVTGVEVNVPAYTQLKTYVFENSVIEENTYSFKFRGLNIEYEVEYKDNTSSPTVLLFNGEKIYVLKEPKYLYNTPSDNDKSPVLIENNTTILIEYEIGNGWVYCITGNKKAGWLKLKTKNINNKSPSVYEDAEYLTTAKNAKPSLLFDDVALFLNQFPDVQGITITTFSPEITPKNISEEDT